MPLETNLVDQVWGASRPERPSNLVFPLDLKYSGQHTLRITLKLALMSYLGVAANDKFAELRKTLLEKKASGMVVNMLDEVAWLFNLRGSDIQFNPGWRPFPFAIQPSRLSFPASILRIRTCHPDQCDAVCQ